MTFPIVEESKVLIATTKYIIKRGVIPYKFSVAQGKGINTTETQSALSELFKSVEFSPQFTTGGADIEAFFEKEWWKIECKGSGTGTSQTQRNNFDRALASVVTYFDEPSNSLGSDYADVRLFLGLALPASPEYLRELTRRVRIPLRKQLNLWVLLYDPSNGSIQAVEPTEDFKMIG
jgi:hypothetical protein